MVRCVKRHLQLSTNLLNVLIWALDSFVCKIPICLAQTLKPNTRSENGKPYHAKQALSVGIGKHNPFQY